MLLLNCPGGAPQAIAEPGNANLTRGQEELIAQFKRSVQMQGYTGYDEVRFEGYTGMYHEQYFWYEKYKYNRD